MRHFTVQDLARLRSGSISAEEAAAFGRHAAECPACASAADEYLHLDASAAYFDAALDVGELAEHPDEEAFVAFVDGSMTPAARGELAAHLRRCDACREDVDDLAHWVAAQRRDRPRPKRWLYAAAALAALALVIWVPRITRKPPLEPVPSPAAAPTAPAPTAPAPKPDSAPSRVRVAEWDGLVARVRSTRTLPIPTEIRALGAPDAFRGQDGGVPDARVQPSATCVVDDRPRFSWPHFAGASYTVTIMEGDRVVARREGLSEAHWRSRTALRRGTTYRWQVTVEGGAKALVLPLPPAPPAIFKIVDQTTHEELQRAAREAPDDHLLLGVLYARAGVIEAARRELERYGRASADPLAKELLSQLPR